MDSKWKKNCPKCGGVQIYSCKSSLTHFTKKNSACNKCSASHKKKIPTNGEWARYCLKCNSKMIYNSRGSYNTGVKNRSICKKCATKQSAKCIDRSFQKTYEYRKRMSESLKKIRSTSSYGESFREKCRENKIKQIRFLGTRTNYNKKSCEFINKLNEQKEWNLQHALNGGEVMISGYSLDGYDPNLNIIFEYDEPKHHTLSQYQKDRKREEILIKKLNPSQFWRYDEKNNKLYNILNERKN